MCSERFKRIQVLLTMWQRKTFLRPESDTISPISNFGHIENSRQRATIPQAERTLLSGLRLALANARARLRNSQKFRLFVTVLNQIIAEDKEPKYCSKMPLNLVQKMGIAGSGVLFFVILYQTAIFPAVVKKIVTRVCDICRFFSVIDE